MVTALILVVLAWAMLARRFAPRSNTNLAHFDTILVLGASSDDDGNPTPEELARVSEGVREYERGVASRILFTGGPAHNQYVEADVMARTAAALGIPPSAIFIEPQSSDTIQNVCYSERIMNAHGWHSAEVISTAYHLPRAGIVLSHSQLQWRTHAAPSLQPESSVDALVHSLLEILKTARYLTYANWAERCEP